MSQAAETIAGALIRAAKLYGSRPAVMSDAGSMSYDELHRRVLKVGALLTEQGVMRGDRVALWLPNSAEFIELALGAAFIGASVVALNTRLKGPEAAYILRKSRPKVLVAIGEFLGVNYGDLLAQENLPEVGARFRVGAGRADWADWHAAVAAIGDDKTTEIARIAATIRPDDIAEIMFTSGTTGFPKGAMLRQGQIVRAYSQWNERLIIDETDRYLIIAPMFHSYGYKAGVLSSILAGAAIYPVATFDVADCLRIIEEHRITVTGGPPTIFISLLAENEKHKRDISSLRSVSSGGSMVPPSMIRALKQLGVKSILNAYGLTECCALATMTARDDDLDTVASTSGRAIDGVEVRCMKLDGTQAAVGEPGEIEVRGFNVMSGYFENEEATRDALRPDGWLRTGDVGVLDERGCLRVTDRMKDMFIVGGFNCFPAEIERIMMDCPMVGQVAVIGIPDERMGEVGKAFVVPKSPSDFTKEKFIAWCRDNMANYKVPREVEVVDVLPRNAMGKLQKFLLRERAAAG